MVFHAANLAPGEIVDMPLGLYSAEIRRILKEKGVHLEDVSYGTGLAKGENPSVAVKRIGTKTAAASTVDPLVEIFNKLDSLAPYGRLIAELDVEDSATLSFQANAYVVTEVFSSYVRWDSGEITVEERNRIWKEQIGLSEAEQDYYYDTLSRLFGRV